MFKGEELSNMLQFETTKYGVPIIVLHSKMVKAMLKTLKPNKSLKVSHKVTVGDRKQKAYLITTLYGKLPRE